LRNAITALVYLVSSAEDKVRMFLRTEMPFAQVV
jgi:hypothetical protein